MGNCRRVHIAADMNNYFGGGMSGITLTVFEDEIPKLIEICNREELEILIEPNIKEGK